MDAGRYKVFSRGVGSLHSPQEPLNFGNAGTGIRLSCGLLAGTKGIEAILTGDDSLLKRPMDRITEPLNSLGADVTCIGRDGRAPLKVIGKTIRSGSYKSKLSSAQVKSCLLFAAMASGSELEYSEPELSRDHTENMIRFLGGRLEYFSPTHFRLLPPYNFEGSTFRIPGDISSATFYIIIGLLATKGSVLKIHNVGLNPSRIGVLDILRNMGGNIEIVNKRSECGELTGDLLVYSSKLQRTEIPQSIIPSIIDEIPALSIAGLFAKGGFSVRHAEDLRNKESDRIHSIVSNFRKLGIHVTEFQDGYEFSEWTGEISDQMLQNVRIESFMDHRIAMSFSILSFLIGKNLSIDDTSWIETSFPGFFKILEDLGE